MGRIEGSIAVRAGDPAKVKAALTATPAWKAALDMGLKQLRVVIDPKNKTRGKVITQWTGLDAFGRFIARYPDAFSEPVETPRVTFAFEAAPKRGSKTRR